ncbi:hypothetical protein CDL12_10239 [Handroanthus impetiginosus]|uniref:Protein CHUP1, chloroplastic n=1 Tax=Handroanthus impetiginosus TaxID=429701 RepID=A0A2G9HHY3_9LAMI|nr:hypothetical protein CDL12_10239 [Handroanthus impetiginosus]
MGLKEKRESPVGPVLFKFGVALAFSLGGIVYSLFRSKIIKPSKSKPSLGSSGMASEADSRGDDLASQELSPVKVSSEDSINDLSSSGRCSGDRDGFLVAELDQLVKECDMAFEQSLVPAVDLPLECKIAEHEEQEREIRNLQSKVKILEERERMLEIQLLEYYGLKEQETAIMELQNRLRVNNMETKLYSLKIESLQSENRRIQAQVADYAEVVAELEAAKAKIKLLRKKLKSEAEQNREQILKLKERVMKLQEEENKGGEIGQDLEMQLQKMKELEEELEEVKKSNHSLKQENSELAEKLEQVQLLATSALDNEEIQALKEERELLRQQNEELRKEIEQLQADRCTDIEQLVYLRWINACLRYEMRNIQPGPGETIARDLSKMLSPKSEEKAKELIIEYANKEGFVDFDPDQWSTSHSSYLTDSGERDDLPLDNSSANKTSKTKVFAKLMKLWRGKDSHNHIQTATSAMERSVSVDDIGSYPRGQNNSTAESSTCSRRTSDDCSLSIFRRINSLTEYDDHSSPKIQPYQDVQNAAKVELVKYAEALKNSRGKSSSRRRSASFGSF